MTFSFINVFLSYTQGALMLLFLYNLLPPSLPHAAEGYLQCTHEDTCLLLHDLSTNNISRIL